VIIIHEVYGCTRHWPGFAAGNVGHCLQKARFESAIARARQPSALAVETEAAALYASARQVDVPSSASRM
jgi:hypothetical protein